MCCKALVAEDVQTGEHPASSAALLIGDAGIADVYGEMCVDTGGIHYWAHGQFAETAVAHHALACTVC